MAASALERLRRWELHGAIWRVRSIDSRGAVVDLLTCYGEPVERLCSAEPELLRFLADRRSSEDSRGC